MPMHYTYEECDSSQLFQGDVLRKEPELEKILNTTFPDFPAYKDYHYLLVLTQSCDLQQRDGKPSSSPYITFAAVSPASEAIWLEARKYQEWWQIPARIVDSPSYNRMHSFAMQLLDNNVPDFFYLHEDASLGTVSPYCAFLRLKLTLDIAVIDACRNAKIGQISESFRAKLGWLVGNMYSRVGTKEWDHNHATPVEKQATAMLTDLLVSFDKRHIDNCLRKLTAGASLERYTPQQIEECVIGQKPTTRISEFSEYAIDALRHAEFAKEVPEKAIKQIVAAIVADTRISRLLA